MDLGIKGRRAIVTGGGSGIGFETARQFLEEGVRVLITGRNEKKLMAARDDLAKRTGGEVHAVVADMTNNADIAKMVDDRQAPSSAASTFSSTMPAPCIPAASPRSKTTR